MEWEDRGIVVATRAFGERAEIVEVMTRTHGRAAGLVRNGKSRRMRPVLQLGNGVSVRWRARLDDQLGTFEVELIEGRAARLVETGHGAFGLQWLTSLLRLLPEREPNRRLHEAAVLVLDRFAGPASVAEGVIRFELLFLEEVGYGLDLSCCAATGSAADLVYVSPRSGRAVSRGAGAPYAPKLLPLPAFLAAGAGPDDAAAAADGFRLTGFFLERLSNDLFDRPLPAGRERFVAAVLRALGGSQERGSAARSA